MFCRSLFVLILLTIVVYVLLRYTDSDYLFGIFKLFLTLFLNKQRFYILIIRIGGVSMTVFAYIVVDRRIKLRSGHAKDYLIFIYWISAYLTIFKA